MKITKGAYDRALASLAERCVTAEARAKVAEAEVVALKQERVVDEENLINLKASNDRWWCAFWKAQGATDGELIKARVEYFRDLDIDASDLIKNMQGGTWSSPTGGREKRLPDWTWPTWAKDAWDSSRATNAVP